MYAQIYLGATDVFVRTSRLECKIFIRTHKLLNTQKLYNLRKAIYVRTSRLTRKRPTTYAKTLRLQKCCTTYATRLLQMSRTKNKKWKIYILSVMACSKKDKSTRVNHYWTKSRKVNAPISLGDLMVKELSSSLEDGEIREMSVLTYSTNEDSTRIKQKIRIVDNPKNLIEVIRARLTISQRLTGKNITTGPNQ